MGFIKSFTIDDYGANDWMNYNAIHEWIEQLSIKYNSIEIIVAVTPKFVDQSSQRELMLDWLKKSKQNNIQIAAHGFTHEHLGNATEFFHFNSLVEEKVQIDKLKQMTQWFNDNGFNKNYFIPPAHGWEKGVTDKILRRMGYKELFSREVEKRPLSDMVNILSQGFLKYRFEDSQYIKVRWRLGLFIPYAATSISRVIRIKVWLLKFIRLGFIQFLLLRSRHNHLEDLDIFIHVQNLENSESRSNIEGLIESIKCR